MKKIGILNGEISSVVSKMGHKDLIAIGDCGLPIPDKTKRIDIALSKDIPSFIDTLKNVSFIVADARKFITQKDQKHRYDIVILDIFNGWSVPDFVFENAFLDNLKQLLKPKGKLFVNYIVEKEYKKKSDMFLEKLQGRFFNVQDKVIYLNRFFLAS